jgi:hypothetical protein
VAVGFTSLLVPIYIAELAHLPEEGEYPAERAFSKLRVWHLDVSGYCFGRCMPI